MTQNQTHTIKVEWQFDFDDPSEFKRMALASGLPGETWSLVDGADDVVDTFEVRE